MVFRIFLHVHLTPIFIMLQCEFSGDLNIRGTLTHNKVTT